MSAVERYSWHESQWQRLSRARAAGRLPHAVLLSGPQGIGKSDFARRLSHALVCPTPDDKGDACGHCAACRLSAAGSHPDQQWVSPEEPGKMIKIDAIRELSAKSVLSAQQGGFRVIVIDPADAMNRASANGLLKTLEEPSSRTVLVLVSSQIHRLPATIRSRCQVVAFPMPDMQQARAWLGQKIADRDLDAVLAISAGAPLRALEAREQEWVQADQRLIDELAILKHRKGNPLHVVQEWRNRPLTLVFDSFKRCMVDLIKSANGLAGQAVYHPSALDDLQSLVEGIDLQQLYGFNDELLQLDRDSTNNLNPQMMLEYLASRWLQITRPGGR